MFTQSRQAAKIGLVAIALLVIPTGISAGEVLPNGSYSHAIEIQVPPGTNGMQPKLSLSYNSGGGNGLMGVGWSIGGISAISRINNGQGVKYLGTDTYAGPGGKLVDISGNRTLFHSESETFSKYEPQYVNCGITVNEPCSWKVTDAAGMVMEFGGTPDSRAPGVNNAVRSWHLNKVTDLSGNFYTVQYTEHLNEIYPEKIIYTQNNAGGISRYRVVEFEYDAHRTDVYGIFSSHSPVTIQFRLTGIKVKTNVATWGGFQVPFTGDLVRKYAMSYDQSPQTRQLRLTSVQEFGSDGVTSLPAQNFTWQEGTPGFFTMQVGLGGWSFGSPPATQYDVLGGDYNGDGKSDTLILGATSYHLMLSNGDGNFTRSQTALADGWNFGNPASRSYTPITADINGDGKTDIIVLGHTIYHIMLSHGDGTFTQGLYSYGGWNFGSPPAANYTPISGDFNGDGYTDIIILADASYHLMTGRGNGTFDLSLTAYGAGWNFGTPPTRRYTPMSGDFDGDGRSDIIILGDVSYHILRSNGNGTFAIDVINYGGWNFGLPPAQYFTPVAGDFNGDGLSDIVVLGATEYHMMISMGDGRFSTSQRSYEGWNFGQPPSAGYTPLTGDFNQDGKTDIIILANTGYHLMISLGDGVFRREQAPYGLWDFGIPPTAFFTPTVGDYFGNGKTVIKMIGSVEYHLLVPAGAQPDKLIHHSTVQGGATAVNYAHAPRLAGAILPGSTVYPNVANSSPRQLVEYLTVFDGRDAAYATTYQYYNGKTRTGTIDQRKDLGFEWVKKTNGTTGVSTVTYFRQDNPDLNYRKWREEEYNGAGQLMLRMDNAYTSNPTIYPGTHFVALNQQQISTYEAGNLLHVKSKDFTYDSYGNTVQVFDAASGVETIQVTMIYAVDTAQNILNRKIEEKQIWEPSANNVTISWKKMVYTANFMTSEEKYLSTSSSWLKTHYAYDLYGNVISVTDPRANVPGDPANTALIQYDSQYRALKTQLTNPLGHVEKIRYDNLAINIAEEEDANGNVQRKEYDVFGRLVKIIEPGDSSIGVGYTKQILYVNDGNPNAQYLEIRYADNSGTGYRFERSYADGLSRIYREEKKGYVETDGSNTTYTIDTLFEFFDETKKISRQSKPFIAGKNPAVFTTNIYDNYARVVQQQTADGYTVDFTYNNGCMPSTTCSSREDAIGYLYTGMTDARDRVVRREDPEGGLVRTDFLPLQVKVSDAGGLVTNTFFDTLGRSTSMQDRNSGVWLYQRDNADNLIQEIAPDGKTIQTIYDALNRIVMKSYPGSSTGDINVAYEYDNNSVANGQTRVTKIIDESGQTIFGYDAKGNISSWMKTMPNIVGGGSISVAFSAEYDQQKRIKKLAYPDGSAVTQFYADAGYLRQVRLLSPGGFFGSPVVTYEGPDLNQQFIRKTGNNVVEKIGYDPVMHRPTSLETILPSSTSIRKVAYSYDGNGNTLSITDILNGGVRTETFTYDGLNRITSAVGAYGSKSYAHDARGRLITKDNQGQTFTDLNHPEAVTNSAEGAYAYDNVGNLEQRLGRQHIYDGENRLKAIKLGSVTKQNFVYDFSGMRTMKIRDDGAKVYYFGGLKNYGALYEIALSPGSSTPQHTKYIYGINSDRAAQITVPNANLVSYAVNTNSTLALIHGGSVSGTLISAYHTTSAYLSVVANMQRDLRVIFYLCAITILGIYLFRTYRRYGRESELAAQSGLVFHTSPLMLIVFTFFYGVGCTSSPTGPNDGLPNSDDVSTAPQVGGANGDTTTKGFPVAGTFFFHSNHIGSLNFITNTLGAVVSEFSYLAYGELDLARSAGADIARYKFATYERDPESGLDNANARLYNPQSGSFASPDTLIPGEGARSQGFNRYMYTEGNPARFNDPGGHGFIVPGHNYTGSGQREGCENFQCKPTTALDDISQEHDEGKAVLFGDAFDNVGKNVDTQLKNIAADAKFIGRFIGKVASLGIFYENVDKAHDVLKEKGWGKVGSWVGAIFLGLFYMVTDIIVGAIGMCLFLYNIAANTLAVIATGVSKLAEGAGKLLSGRFEEWWDDIW